MPVSSPSRALSGWARQRWVKESPPVVVDHKGQVMAEAEVGRQNEELRRQMTSLTMQIEELKKLWGERESVGDAFPYCTPLKVFAGDSGARASLLVDTGGVQSLRSGMPVLYQRCLVGRLENVSVGSAQVKLTTDSGFRVSGAFRRFVQNDKGQGESHSLETGQPPLVEGDGKGRMFIRLEMKEVNAIGLKPGDWVVLNETGPDWPLILQGYKLGEVTSIGARTDQPLYAQVEVRPPGNWMQLREVMVMNKR